MHGTLRSAARQPWLMQNTQHPSRKGSRMVGRQKRAKPNFRLSFEERGKRAWLKRAYFQMVEEVVCPNAAP